MADGITTIKDKFLSDAARAAYDAALGAAGLDPLPEGVAFRRHRRLLRGVSQLPALAVELDKVTGEPVAAGLWALDGCVTLYLALGRADDPALLERAEAYADALRDAIEGELRDGFHRLAFHHTHAEGVVYSEAGPALRLVPVSFEFRWLYTL